MNIFSIFKRKPKQIEHCSKCGIELGRVDSLIGQCINCWVKDNAEKLEAERKLEEDRKNKEERKQIEIIKIALREFEAEKNHGINKRS